MTDNDKKDTVLRVRMKQEKIDAYREAAERDGRTLSNWVERVLDLALQAKPEGA
jgi:hypothetical protein